jgi:hypothetical protein
MMRALCPVALAKADAVKLRGRTALVTGATRRR